MSEEASEWGPGGQPSASKQIEIYNDSLSKNTPKKKSGTSKPGSGVSQYRYPRSYTDNKRDYLAITISNYTSEDRKNIANKQNAAFDKYEEFNQKNEKTGRSKFRVRQDKGLGLGTFNTFSSNFRKSGKKAHTYINLPVPEQLQDTNAVNWNEDTINPIEATAINALSGAAMDPGSIAAKGEALGEYVRSGAWKSADQMKGLNKELFTKWIAAQAVSKFSNVNPQSVIARTTGQVMQSNMELLVDRPSLRNFTFSWDLMARDNSESKEILQIIRSLKKAMAMKTGATGGKNAGNALFLKSPDIFELTYKKGSRSHPFLHNFKPCALSNLTTTYTGSGTYSTYQDGTPTHVILTASFQEINPIYAEDYADSRGKLGVGY